MLLTAMRDFHGWDARARRGRTSKWDVKHFNDIERVAMVGDKKWQEWTAAFGKPFQTAKVRYFDHEKLDEGRTWATSPV